MLPHCTSNHHRCATVSSTTARSVSGSGMCAGVTSGGGGVCGTLAPAAMAVATGQATHVVSFRASNRGKRSVVGPGKFGGGRPWERAPALLTDFYQYHIPFGLVTPAQEM